jgi:hypothetical protein
VIMSVRRSRLSHTNRKRFHATFLPKHQIQLAKIGTPQDDLFGT